MNQDGEAIKKPKDINKELGYSGTLIYSGLITSEEYNRDLTGTSGNKKYEIMRRSDSTIHSALQVVKQPLLSTSWNIEAARTPEGEITDEDKSNADFIKRELFNRNVNFFDLIKQSTTSFDFGFSVFEKVLELTTFDGKTRVGIKKIASRKQISIAKWEMEDGNPGIYQQTKSGQSVSIPREKLIIFTNDKEGDNYEGISLLRYIYKDWDIKDKLTIVNAMAGERHAMGIPIAQAREGVTPGIEDQIAVEEVLRNIRANQESYLKAPSTYDVSMMDMKSSSTKELIPTLQYHDRRIFASILAAFMELGGSSGSGSQALSKDLSSFFIKAEETVAKEIVATITNDLIKQLCDLNFTDLPNGYPKLTYGTIGDEDNNALSESISKLMSAGAITADAEIEDNLRGRYRLPLMSKEMHENYEEKKKDQPTKEPTKPIVEKSTKASIVKAAQEYRNSLILLLDEE